MQEFEESSLVILSTPSNKPTFEEPTNGNLLLPLPTYDSLANFAGVKLGSIDGNWMFANLETS